jgi:Protein of unknown function (DUF3047)
MQVRQQSVISAKSGWFLRLGMLATLVYGGADAADAGNDATATVSPADLAGGQEMVFAGRTLYRVQEEGDVRALHATAAGSASGLCRAVQLDLTALPIVRWTWRLDRAPTRTDERSRAGDDQGLRLSFLHQAGAGQDSILAVQYIWSQNEPVGAGWPNPFAAHAHQVVARSGPAQRGAWQVEQRDLAADFRAAFGRGVDRIDAICVMTDGDQTGALVEAWYGEITLKAR